MVKKGLWSPEEDEKLRDSIAKYVHGSWSEIAQSAGLQRCGRSCRQRWFNHLRPGLKKGKFSTDEIKRVLELHEKRGNRWCEIAAHLEGRTDNEVKNLWNTVLKRRCNSKGQRGDEQFEYPNQIEAEYQSHQSTKDVKNAVTRANMPNDDHGMPANFIHDPSTSVCNASPTASAISSSSLSSPLTTNHFNVADPGALAPRPDSRSTALSIYWEDLQSINCDNITNPHLYNIQHMPTCIPDDQVAAFPDLSSVYIHPYHSKTPQSPLAAAISTYYNASTDPIWALDSDGKMVKVLFSTGAVPSVGVSVTGISTDLHQHETYKAEELQELGHAISEAGLYDDSSIGFLDPLHINASDVNEYGIIIDQLAASST